MPFGQNEDRTRVTCHLPVRDAGEEKAFKEVIAYLRNQRQRRIGVDGYTYSRRGTFYGYWWNNEVRSWVEDAIVLLLVDYRINIGDPRSPSISALIAELKLKIHESYLSYGRTQDEIWVVAHSIERYTDAPQQQ